MKKGDERRGQILASAEKFFYQKGYENTSIQDILDDLKISKGGFYHHFESKLQVLIAITEQRTLARRQQLNEAVNACAGNALDKLNLLLEMGLPWQADDMAFAGLILRVGYQGESLQVKESVKQSLLRNARPLMEQIICEGIEQKLFYTRFPGEIGELLLMLYANINDEIAAQLAGCRGEEVQVGQLIDRLDACRYAVEQLLNAPYGSIRLFDLSILPDILKQLNEQNRRKL